jgi:two-component system, chemotaxis family, response regulator Rcp1
MEKMIDILLVEDNPADVELTREHLALSKIRNELHVVMNGLEALQYLRHEDSYKDATRPDLILLDLNLPGMDGREVLGEIKEDPKLKSIPIVILTSSDAEQDVVKTYDLGANCYVQKPVDLARFETIVKAIEDFWFTIVKLPPK